jgi:hypothetical protein
MTAQPTRPVCSRFGQVAVLLAAGALVGGGCLSEETRTEMADQESVLAPIFKQPTEFDAVIWANDEYDSDKRARGTALLAFSPYGDDPKYVNYLYRRYLTDKDANVRTVAAVAMGLHGTPDDVPQIVPLLRDSDKHVRKATARALQRLHNSVAIDPLMDAIDGAKEPEWDVRAEAADALGQYPENKVLQKLIATLDDEQLIVNQTTVRSLKTLTGQDLGVDRRAWAKWVRDAKDPFAARMAYVYPAYSRDKTWLEYIPFIPNPPNEIASTPVGMPPVR